MASYGYGYGYASGVTIEDAKRHVHTLVMLMQQHLPRYGIVVDKVVKSGSLGHGTAIQGDFDIDLVLYTQSITKEQVAHCGVGEILEKLATFLQHQLPKKATDISMTKYSINFRFHKEVKVDLLPSPCWRSEKGFIEFLNEQSLENRRKFSCSVAEWEQDFFQKQDSRVKEYIKKVKAWRNKIWPEKQDHSGRPKSFLLSVLMVEAYNNTDNKFDPAAVTRQFKALVRNHNTLHINHTRYQVPYQEPYVMDPANPFNNLYESGIDYYKAHSNEGSFRPGNGNWSSFAQNIESLDLY